MKISSFELALPATEILRRLTELLGQRDIEMFARMAGGAGQWGIDCRALRNIVHVDGSIETRPLRARFVGGEGISVYIGMGGLRRPPAYVGTIQTGRAEAHDGPLAKLFSQQTEAGMPTPEVWVRGQQRKPGFEPFPMHSPLEPSPPFAEIGQSFAGWRSDRMWPSAVDTRREVKAWTKTSSSPRTEQFGPHTISSQPIDLSAVVGTPSVCLPAHLGETLGISGTENVFVVPRFESPPGFDGAPLPPMADVLRAWQETPAFVSAERALLVPCGYEDEVVVLARWLRQTSLPAVTVHLAMDLDFEAFIRATGGNAASASLINQVIRLAP